MMKRISIIIISLFFVLLLFCAVFLSTTESGLILIQKSINRFGSSVVSIGQVEGSLFGNGTFKNIHFADVGMDVDVDRLEYSWQPGKLLEAEFNIAKISVTGVKVAIKDTPSDTPATSAFKLPVVLFPFPVVVGSFVVNKLSVVDSHSELFVVDKCIASLQGNADQLTVNEFDLQGQDIGLRLHGNIEVKSEWTLNLLGNWRLAGFGFHPLTGTLSVSGPLKGPHLELGLNSPANIRVAGDFVNLLEQPEWTAKLEAKAVDLSTLIEDCPKIELTTVNGELAGNFENYRGQVHAGGAWDALTGMHLVSNITGDFLGIDFRSLRIENEESSVQVEGGKISWQDIFSWEGRFLVKNFDPSVINGQLQGRLEADFVSVGDVKEHGVIASFDISSLNGILRDHKISAAGNVFLNETDVHTDALIIQSGDLTGRAYIKNGLFSWADAPLWSGNIQLDEFDPSWLYPDFPGNINGELATQGKLGEKGPEGSLTIKNISGNLRGNDLSGGGEVTLAGGTIKTKGLLLNCGPSRLVVKGLAGEGLALDFSLTSPDIGTILPESKGNILFRGKLTGTINTPQLDAELQGSGLRYRGNSLGRAQAEIHTALKKDGRLTGSLLGENISLDGYSINKSVIKITGTLAEHQIVVNGEGETGDFSLRSRGTYRNEWLGELSQINLNTADYGTWRQEKTSKVTMDRDGFSLEKLCLTDGESTACLGGDVRLEEELLWTASGQLASVPLEWLNRLNLMNIPVNGAITADIAAKGNTRRIISAKSELRVLAGDLSVKEKDTDRVPLRFDDSVLTLDLTEALLQGNFNIRLKNGSQVILTAAVEGAGDFAVPLSSLPLRGTLELKNFNLAMLSAFTGYGVEPNGRVNDSLVLSGTVGQPKIDGKINLQDGGIDLPYQGITLENIMLSIEAGAETTHVTCKATSGPGQLTATGVLQYGTAGVKGELNIKGTDFLLVSLPEYAIRVNPDIVLTFNKDKSEIRGSIEVPYGVITPEEMDDSISASEDVIILNGTRKERANGWPFNLDINVRLGDDVRIDGYGLKGRLLGELRAYTTPDDFMAGKGELDLMEGTFSIYGRTLSIERGSMLFTGGPVDNPGVDIRAQVEVSAEEAKGEGYTVGLDISGLVQDLQYHLFSDPYMEDTEILSLMIVGHSLSDSTQKEGNILEAAAVTLGMKQSLGLVREIGSLLRLDDLHFEGSSSKENVSLVVGKRVTKDLYIGYDLNMFNQIGQLRVRYDLSRGFSVETRSSSESTGADLLYTFER